MYSGLMLWIIDLLEPIILRPTICGLIGGFSLFFWLSFKKRDSTILEGIAAIGVSVGLFWFGLWGFLSWFTEYNSTTPAYDWGFSTVAGFVLAVLVERYVFHWFEKRLSGATKKSSLERDKKTDVRNIEKLLPLQKENYDPEIFFKDGAFFIGLGTDGKPIYWDGDLPHIQVCGTTGSGKGVFLGAIAAQCAKKKEAVFIVDPKDDEFFPHVAKKSADLAGVDYHFINLSVSTYQINIFQDTTEDERKELLFAGFELGDTGDASDFYRITDRKMATFIAKTAKKFDTAESLYSEHAKYLSQAEGFEGKFAELAAIKAVNAENGLSLKEIIENGGVVYIVGSMRNPEIIRIQKMLLVRLIQIAEARDRVAGNLRKICVVLDEFKYHLSRTALEALGAARDKGLHVIMAHQSLGDLEDCPSDLSPKAVVDSVFENGVIKLLYRVQNPETAEFFARKSGTILVDDEIRHVEKSLSLTDNVSADRQVRQTERFLMDENMILNLPKGCGIVFGLGKTKFAYTSPVKVQKNYESLAIKGSGGADLGEKEKIMTFDDLD